jgi:nicotinamide mononucleotide transporter
MLLPLLPLEIVGTCLGLLNLWLTIRQNIWCWPIGIACVVCFGMVFFEARLYSDLLLQGFYVVVQLYGWWFWISHGHHGVHSTYSVKRLNGTQMLKWGGAIIAVSLSLGACMAKFTNADLPYVDAVPTTISMAAAWLQARKILQSWQLFILSNLLFIGVYASKGLYVTIALYVVSTVLATFGYLDWAKSSPNNQTNNL